MSRRAVLLVRNGVTHDARVQRAAGVLQELGYAVTIIGSLTAGAPAGARGGSPGATSCGCGRAHRSAPCGASPGAGFPARSPPRIARSPTLDWNRRALRELRRLRPELIHANDYNTMWPALAARRLVGARVLYDSHELWADRNGRPEWRRWLLRAERRFVRRADAVITASPGYSAAFASRYGIAAPIVIRNIPVSSPAS